MKSTRKYFTLLCFLITLVNYNASAEETKNHFFKNPSCELMEKNIQLASKEDPKNKDLQEVWTTMVLDTKPACIKTVEDNFSTYSANEREIYLIALANIGRGNLAEKIADQYQIKVPRSDGTTVADIKNLDVNNNTNNMDRAWAAFDATGDITYPKKITAYLATQDEFSRQMGAELVNRRMLADFAKKANIKGAMGIDDLVTATQKKYGLSQEEALNKLLPIAAAYYSLWLNENQDPELKQQLESKI